MADMAMGAKSDLNMAMALYGVGIAGMFLLGGYFVTTALPQRADETVLATFGAPDAGVEDDAAKIGAKPSLPASMAGPSFDLVRIDPKGDGVLAGRAPANSLVIFTLDTDEFAQVTTDRSGHFALALDLPASDSPRVLSMRARLEGGKAVSSKDRVLISPIYAADEPLQTASAVGSEGQGTFRQGSSPILLGEEGDISLVSPAPRPARPVAHDKVTLVSNVVIDMIAYDTEGEVALSGRGASDGFVRVYLNDRPVQIASIATDGAWDAPLPNIDAGVYRLRVDELSKDGQVTSRVETPFQREEAALAAQATVSVTVQPGFTLWRIAQEQLGNGVQYVRVYEANRDLIRNPDLIYPGQVFELPSR